VEDIWLIKILHLVLQLPGQQDLIALMYMHSCAINVKEIATQLKLWQTFLQLLKELNTQDSG